MELSMSKIVALILLIIITVILILLLVSFNSYSHPIINNLVEATVKK